MRVNTGAITAYKPAPMRKNFINNKYATDTVSFSSALAPKRISGFYKAFYKCKNLGGEMESTILNGVGKTLIAPIAIIFNPISSDDRDSRFYSAWKQPIEGIVSTVLQLGILVKANKYIHNLAQNGKLEKYNISRSAIKTVAEDIVKQRHKELNIFKARVGLGLTLLTTPAVCSSVNYIFPKFMQTAFPKISTVSQKGEKA